MARRKKNKKNIDAIFIILLISSVISAIIIYLKTGYIGEVISPIIGGILGPVKYVLPVGIFFLAIATAKEEKKSYTSRIIQFLLIITILCSLLTILEVSKENISVDSKAINIISDSYELGRVGIAGGAVGAVVAIPFIKLFGLVGAGIILAVSVFILIFTTYAGSPTMYLRDKIEERKDIKEEKYKIREKERLKREKEREKTRAREERYREKEEFEGQLRFNLEKELPPEVEERPSFFERMFSRSKDMGVDNDSHHMEEIKENEIIASLKDDKPHVEEKQEAKINFDISEGALEDFEINEEDKLYESPDIGLLKEGKPISRKDSERMITTTAKKIQQTLYSFGVSAKVDDVSIGPAVTRYELTPAEGVRVNKIASLSDDIALNLAAQSLRIEAPIPGKQAVGIEVPNEIREIVSLRDVLESEEFKKEKSKVGFALGKATSGEYMVVDIAKMPHILIAGSTGSGKSICINTIINSIVYNAKPSEVKLILVDPKVVELSVYNTLPHLATREVITDPQLALGVLSRVVHEMTRRFQLFAKANAKNIDSFNSKSVEKIPYLVVIIDELADLMMTAAKDVEARICRIAQMGRAAGIHLVVATQRPSVDVITGLIKANMPTRIAFAVTSQIDSRTILDQSGAEKLLGKGDMLYYPIGATRPIRVQGSFISEKEINNIMNRIKRKTVPEAADRLIKNAHKDLNPQDNKEAKDKKISLEDMKQRDDEDKELLIDIIDFFIREGSASISLIRRKYRMGDSRAGRIIDQIEEMGIISKQQGNQARRVLISELDWQNLKVKLFAESSVNADNENIHEKEGGHEEHEEYEEYTVTDYDD